MLDAKLIAGFTDVFLRDKFDGPVPIPAVHMEWWDLFCSPKRYVALSAPRGHAKSTALTHCFSLANICFRVKKHVLIVSDTFDQSTLFLSDIKKELRENEDLIDTFNIKDFSKDRESEFIVKFADGHEIRAVARGSEQKMRGLKWNNTRPDLIICDDLENDELVENEDRRFKFRRWFYNSLLPAGNRTCQVRVVGTILHMDSLLMRLMPQESSKDTVVTPLKIYSNKPDKKAWESVLYRAHPSIDDFSYILWPEMWPRDRLELERQRYLDDGYPEGYTQEYLNCPVDFENAYFRKQDVLPISSKEKHEKTKEPEEYYAAIDMAISEKDLRAYTAIVVCGLGSSGKLRVRDVRRFRGDALEIIEEMFSVQLRYQPELFVVEDENISKTLGSILQEEQIKRNTFINIYTVDPHGRDKIRRARPLQARMRAGGVEFDHEAKWFPDFQQELLHFPKGKYADQVDALAWVGFILHEMGNVPTQQEIEDRDYEEEYEEYAADAFFGRSRVTGY